MQHFIYDSMSKLSLAAFIAFSLVAGADEASVGKTQERSKHLIETLDLLDIWWARPKDEKWSRFSFLKLKHPVESSFRKAIKNSKDNPDAGDYYTLEAPFAVANKKPQGFIILVNQERQIIASFRFRYSTINKKALEWVKILKCDFQETLEYNASMSLKGIELDRTIEDLLGGEK